MDVWFCKIRLLVLIFLNPSSPHQRFLTIAPLKKEFLKIWHFFQKHFSRSEKTCEKKKKTTANIDVGTNKFSFLHFCYLNTWITKTSLVGRFKKKVFTEHWLWQDGLVISDGKNATIRIAVQLPSAGNKKMNCLKLHWGIPSEVRIVY